MDVLIVDGYNIIGAWDELQKLKQLDLGQARDRLIHFMADYQAYKGMKVILVFDAHFVPGKESKAKTHKVDLIYTKENESADECIEKLVTVYKNVENQVYVATSDYLEQRITFGRGALRQSARELFIEIEEMQKEIATNIQFQHNEKTKSNIRIQEDILEIFEKWRRGR